MLHDHTQIYHNRQDSLGRVIARPTDLYLTAPNTHKRQTPMAPAGFKPTIPASQRQQTHV